MSGYEGNSLTPDDYQRLPAEARAKVDEWLDAYEIEKTRCQGLQYRPESGVVDAVLLEHDADGNCFAVAGIVATRVQRRLVGSPPPWVRS